MRASLDSGLAGPIELFRMKKSLREEHVMWKTALNLAAVLSFAAIAFPGEGMAQGGTFPDRPIKFIVPYGPGGTVDPTARILASNGSGT